MNWGQSGRADSLDALPWEASLSAVAVLLLILVAAAIFALFEPWKWGRAKEKAARRDRRRRRIERRRSGS